jgi:hypothetical protein
MAGANAVARRSTRWTSDQRERASHPRPRTHARHLIPYASAGAVDRRHLPSHQHFDSSDTPTQTGSPCARMKTTSIGRTHRSWAPSPSGLDSERPGLGKGSERGGWLGHQVGVAEVSLDTRCRQELEHLGT